MPNLERSDATIAYGMWGTWHPPGRVPAAGSSVLGLSELAILERGLCVKLPSCSVLFRVAFVLTIARPPGPVAASLFIGAGVIAA